MTFTFGGEPFEYFDHLYNSTALNERAVEIPIVLAWVATHGINTEVGNVLSHYGASGHRVIDRYEESPGVENVDVFDAGDDLGNVVAISTLEHVRWDEPERDPHGAVRALEYLRASSSRLLVTVPMGHHPTLDAYLLDSGAGSTLVRCYGGWVETAEPKWLPYGASTAWAESVWIGEFR